MLSQARRRQRGFTIIELMVAVAIIGILAAIAVPSFRTYQWKAKRGEAFVNLGSLANSQKAYFAVSDAYLAVSPAEPGQTLGDIVGTNSRSSAGIDTAFAAIGFASEGQVYFDYDTNAPILGAGCPCVQCFTSTAYGDVDGDGLVSAMMFVHPGSAGGACASSMLLLAPPVDPFGLTIFDQVARHTLADDY